MSNGFISYVCSEINRVVDTSLYVRIELEAAPEAETRPRRELESQLPETPQHAEHQLFAGAFGRVSVGLDVERHGAKSRELGAKGLERGTLILDFPWKNRSDKLA
jgi:hypothetical protein